MSRTKNQAQKHATVAGGAISMAGGPSASATKPVTEEEARAARGEHLRRTLELNAWVDSLPERPRDHIVIPEAGKTR